jgi:glycosyltransferase involved in cell wall biosynthesis
MNKPLVSVLVDTYNHERYIEQTLLSVLDQGLSPQEQDIIVVDDGSTDSTPEIIRKFEPRVRLIQKKNGGQGSAFNVGISETCGEIVAFLDGDDWWAPRKLQTVLDVFSRNRDVAAVGHGFYNVDETGTPIDIFAPDKTRRLDLSSSEAARVADLGRTLLGTSRMSVRRTVLEQIGPLPLELTYCADTPILTLSLALGGAIVIDQPLCYYRQHSANLFAPHLQTDPTDASRLRRRYEVLEFLLGYLTHRLTELGVPISVVDALFESDRIELKRFQLQDEKRGRWANFRVEQRSFRWQSKNWSAGYFVFKVAIAGLALLLPPERFHEVRNWYARQNLRRFREAFGKAESAVPPTMFKRTPILKRD